VECVSDITYFVTVTSKSSMYCNQVYKIKSDVHSVLRFLYHAVVGNVADVLEAANTPKNIRNIAHNHTVQQLENKINISS
jgi:hypothetical protein